MAITDHRLGPTHIPWWCAFLQIEILCLVARLAVLQVFCSTAARCLPWSCIIKSVKNQPMFMPKTGRECKTWIVPLISTVGYVKRANWRLSQVGFVWWICGNGELVFWTEGPTRVSLDVSDSHWTIDWFLPRKAHVINLDQKQYQVINMPITTSNSSPENSLDIPARVLQPLDICINHSTTKTAPHDRMRRHFLHWLPVWGPPRDLTKRC